MVRFVVFLLLANIALIVVALIDCLSTDKHEVRNLPRAAWAWLIVLFSPFAGIAWFFAGRPATEVAASAPARPAGRAPAPTTPPALPTRTLAPDDDPEFLRDVASRARRAREDRLQKWEDDLKRREDELRRRTDDPPGGI
jgi:hypothetical protein